MSFIEEQQTMKKERYYLLRGETWSDFIPHEFSFFNVMLNNFMHNITNRGRKFLKSV